MARSPPRRGDGKGGKGELDNAALELHDSVMHACGGRREVAKEVIAMLDEALESGVLSAARGRCAEFLRPLEDADGEREGRDRGSHRFLKAVNVLLRLKGFNSRDRMMPIREIELTGQPLLGFTAPNRGVGAPPGRPEPVVRSLELAVHLARSSNHVVTMRLGECELSADGGDKCVTEVARLVRQVGIGSQARFLEEVDLHGNALDAEAVRKIVEAAVKERCERPRAYAGSPPLWLDLSLNRVRNPATVFQNLQAWASWAHDKDSALCFADQEGCGKKECSKGAMLHMPKFLEQSKLDGPQVVFAIGTGATDAEALIPAPLAARATMLPPRPQAWRDVEDLPRSLDLVREEPPRRARERERRRSKEGGRRKRSKRSRSRDRDRRRRGRRKEGAATTSTTPRVVLKPGPASRAARRGQGNRRRRSHSASRVVTAVEARCASSAEDSTGEEDASASSQMGSTGAAASQQGEGSVIPGGGTDASAVSSRSPSMEPSAEGVSSGGSSASASPSPVPAARAPRFGAQHARPPTPEELEQRMNRLIESLKTSTKQHAQATAGRPSKPPEDLGRSAHSPMSKRHRKQQG